MPFKLHSPSAPSSQLIFHSIIRSHPEDIPYSNFMHLFHCTFGELCFMSVNKSFQENLCTRQENVTRKRTGAHKDFCVSLPSVQQVPFTYISSPCPVSLRNLVSRVPELRGAHCTLHGSPSRESGTRVLAARGHTPGKWERNPQLIHSTSPHSIPTLESVRL